MNIKKFFLIVPFLVFSVFAVFGQQADTEPKKEPRPLFYTDKPSEVFSILQGKWDWEYLENSCKDNPFTISFANENKQLFLTYQNAPDADEKLEKKTYIYNLTAYSRFGVRGQIENEQRLTESGKPVVWEFMLLSKDEFCWHQTDSPTGTCTKSIVRCK